MCEKQTDRHNAGLFASQDNLYFSRAWHDHIL